jgi:hypothetical protein
LAKQHFRLDIATGKMAKHCRLQVDVSREENDGNPTIRTNHQETPPAILQLAPGLREAVRQVAVEALSRGLSETALDVCAH